MRDTTALQCKRDRLRTVKDKLALLEVEKAKLEYELLQRVREMEKATIAKEESLRKAREQYGIKVMCPRCFGTGEVGDPHDSNPCEGCDGDGFLWAIRWESKTISKNRLTEDGIEEKLNSINDVDSYR